MKFVNWIHSNALNTISTANNMRISSNQSSTTTTTTITAADTYSFPMTITGDMDSTRAGKQIQITVEMAVPNGTANGSYSTNYAVHTQ